LIKAKAVKCKIKSFNSNVKVQSFRSLSELLFFACAKKSNQKKAPPGLRAPGPLRRYGTKGPQKRNSNSDYSPFIQQGSHT